MLSFVDFHAVFFSELSFRITHGTNTVSSIQVAGAAFRIRFSQIESLSIISGLT